MAVIASVSTKVTVASRQIFDRSGLPDGMRGEWRLLKYVEEAEFGPDAGVNTVFLIGSLVSKLDGLPGQIINVLVFSDSKLLNRHVLCVAESCKWMTKECALGLLSEAKPGSDRIGQYAYIGLMNSRLSSNSTAVPALPSQVSTVLLPSVRF
jgi:hypothetical protein